MKATIATAIELCMPRQPMQAIAHTDLTRRIHLLCDFLSVAEKGSVRQAAASVHLSQSALTRRIQDLEDGLGVALFERTSRGMALTPFGRALRHHAQMIDLSCGYAVNELNELLGGGSGELRVAAGPAWAYSLVPDALASLNAKYPKVRVSLLSRLNSTTIPMLRDGQVDVVIGGLPEVKERDPEIVYEPVLEIDHLVFAADDHTLRGRRRLGPRDLTAFPWISFAGAVLASERLVAYFASAKVDPPAHALESSSIQAGFRLMRRSNYLMVLPSTLRQIAGEVGISPLPRVGSLGGYTAGLMYRPSALRLRAFSEFRESLVVEAKRFSTYTAT